MKKLLAIIAGVILTFSITGMTWASGINTTIHLEGELWGGYLALPGYTADSLGEWTNHNKAYDKGAFYSEFRSMKLRLINDVTFCNGFYGELVNQWEIYKDEGARTRDLTSSAIQNVNLTYNPGFALFMLDTKGQELLVGIKDDEILKLNVARRFAKDAEPHIYRDFENDAKQLTVQVPFDMGRVVSLFSLEQADPNDSNPIHWAGGFAEVTLGNNKFALAYQPKMVGSNYRNPVYSPYYAVHTDFMLASDTELQVDYSSRYDKDSTGNKTGYIAYWKPIDFLEIYPGTEFHIKGHINSRLNYKNYLFKLRILDDVETDKWDKYWADASYYFKPYTVGINYRNFAMDAENDKAHDDGYVAEYYVKHDLNPSWRDYLKVFYRSDKSYGAVVTINFW